MALMQMPAKITAFFLTISENKYVILMLINFMLLVLGCLMDMAPLILICTPILLPVVVKLGVDPVHFGMIMLLNLGIGLLTPPVGSMLFVGCAVGKVKMEEVMRDDLAVLQRDVRGADARDLCPGAVAVVPGACRSALSDRLRFAAHTILRRFTFSGALPNGCTRTQPGRNIRRGRATCNR